MRTCLALLATAATLGTLAADDWPHWMGPKRDNIWRETGILEKFPEGGPKRLWSFPVAGGYAGPAVVDGLVYITDYAKKQGETDEGNFERKETTGVESVYCVDAKTGKEVWKHSYDVKYAISYPAGPRCTPTVDADRVYTLGAEGDLYCFERKTGKILWNKNLKAAYNTKSALWGYSGHPLVDGKKLITLAGGEGSHVVALDKLTGEEIWKAETQEEQGYVPPTIIEFAGVRQLLVPGPRAVRAVDPETGKRLWSVPFESTAGSVIMTPIIKDDYLYMGCYQNKNMLLKLSTDKPGATMEWKNKRNHGISAVNVQPFLDDGIMYGFDENGLCYAIELPSGKRLWETDEIVGYGKVNGTAFLVKNGSRYYIFTETGDLVIGELSKAGYKEIDRATELVKPTGKASGRPVVWSQPAFANKAIYARNDEELVAYDLAK